MYDVAIIGGGVTGCAVAREISRFKLNTCLIEKEADICCGSSKANSGIVHAGFDAAPGSLHARLNIEGARLMPQYARDLDFPYIRNGSLVLCFSEDDRPELEKLYHRGISNGVEQLRIVEREDLLRLEPNICKEAVAALYAPTAGIVCPFSLTIALAENAAANGVAFMLDTTLEKVTPDNGAFSLETSRGTIRARVVINAAGLYGDMIHNQVSDKKIEIVPRKGEYCLLDNSIGPIVSSTTFQLPGRLGKGVLVTPTVHGNILIGPTAEDVHDKEGVDTTAHGIAELTKKALLSVPSLPIKSVITSFAGLRAHISQEKKDFVIGFVPDCPDFIDAVGIESPGLTSSPAIGRYVAGLVSDRLHPEEKDNFIGTRKGILNPQTLPFEQLRELIKRKPEYGHIICRCEVISEGEIIDAICRPLGATTLDGIKRRTRASMGRCQGGFCAPKIMDILSREMGLMETRLKKWREGSELLAEKIER